VRHKNFETSKPAYSCHTTTPEFNAEEHTAPTAPIGAQGCSTEQSSLTTAGMSHHAALQHNGTPDSKSLSSSQASPTIGRHHLDTAGTNLQLNTSETGKRYGVVQSCAYPLANRNRPGLCEGLRLVPYKTFRRLPLLPQVRHQHDLLLVAPDSTTPRHWQRPRVVIFQSSRDLQRNALMICWLQKGVSIDQTTPQ